MQLIKNNTEVTLLTSFLEGLVETVNGFMFTEYAKEQFLYKRSMSTAFFIKSVLTKHGGKGVVLYRQNDSFPSALIEYHGIKLEETYYFLGAVGTLTEVREKLKLKNFKLTNWNGGPSPVQEQEDRVVVLKHLWDRYKITWDFIPEQVFGFFPATRQFVPFRASPEFLNYNTSVGKKFYVNQQIKKLFDMGRKFTKFEREQVGCRLNDLFSSVKENNRLEDILDEISFSLPTQTNQVTRWGNDFADCGVRMEVVNEGPSSWVDIRIGTDIGNFYI